MLGKTDGSLRNNVVSETFANVKIRKKCGNEDENTNISHITREAQRKRTSTVDNILNHVTENNVHI